MVEGGGGGGGGGGRRRREKNSMKTREQKKKNQVTSNKIPFPPPSPCIFQVDIAGAFLAALNFLAFFFLPTCLVVQSASNTCTAGYSEKFLFISVEI